MNCDEVRELAGAYALDALPEEERQQVDEHLRSCDLHDELAALRATALGLAVAAPEREPPAELLARIIAAALAPERSEQRFSDVPTSGRRSPLPWLRRHALAAALAALVVVLGAWNVALQFGDSGGTETFVHLYRAENGLWLRVETQLGEPHAGVALGGLERLPADQTYQLWAVRDGRWLSVGTFNANVEGRWQGDFDFALQSGDEIAVTVESAGGSERPTSDPLMSTRL